MLSKTSNGALPYPNRRTKYNNLILPLTKKNPKKVSMPNEHTNSTSHKGGPLLICSRILIDLIPTFHFSLEQIFYLVTDL